MSGRKEAAAPSVLVLLLSVAAVMAYIYFTTVDWPFAHARRSLHNKIIAGTADSPYRYRVLIPFAADALTRTLSALFGLRPRSAFLVAYAAYDLLAIFAVLATLLSWLRTWFTREQALVGTLFVAGTMPIALRDHYYQPWSLLEAALFMAALLAIERRRSWTLAGLMALASLNRETAIFIPLAFLLVAGVRGSPSPRLGTWDLGPGTQFVALLLIWALVYVGLRWLRGGAPHVESIAGLFALNTARLNFLTTLINVGLFLGGFWILALLGFRFSPPLIRRLAWILPPYLATVILWGVWYEVRLLMPLYPVLVPMGLSYLYPPRPDRS